MDLKICHVITRLDCGGSAENTLLTAIGLRGRGFTVDIICGRSDNPPSPRENDALAQGVGIIRINDLVRPISPLRDTIALLRLARLLKARGYDLLHTHTSKAGIIGRIAGYMAKVPVIVHTPHGHIFYGYFSALLTLIFTWLERIVTRKTHALITLTKKEKQDYLARAIGRPERMYPILSGIDLAPYREQRTGRAERRALLGIGQSDFVVGTVARLVQVKNHALIIDAAALIKDCCPGMRFVFVGDGDLRDSLTSRIRLLGMEPRFIFLGWRNDIPECLSAFDLFVMCSHNEGMGRAFIEAQAGGIPVIGSRVGGVEEAIVEGKTGFLVDPTDPCDLAAVLERLYNDRTLLTRMAQACRAFVDPTFSKETMVAAIDNLYCGLFNERRKV
jgi:glycosyltransferase involved in cell wall biosynthesis